MGLIKLPYSAKDLESSKDDEGHHDMVKENAIEDDTTVREINEENFTSNNIEDEELHGDLGHISHCCY